MDKADIIKKLRELQSRIPEFKERDFTFADTPEFHDWCHALAKWLRQGEPYTSIELRRVEYRDYRERGTEEYYSFYGDEEQYQEDQQKKYQDALGETWYDISHAIENLEQGIVNKRPETIRTPAKMRDQYIVQQAAAVGPGAHAQGVTLNQLQADLNLPQLTVELATLREALKSRASEPEHQMEIGAITAAEVAAKQGNAQKALTYLQKTGKWTFDIAKQIGIPLAIEYLGDFSK